MLRIKNDSSDDYAEVPSPAIQSCVVSNESSYPRPTTPEGREAQLIAAAYDLAERQIREGTASSQVISHFLKMGTQEARLQREILAEQKKLVVAKTESIESMKERNVLYQEAINAIRHYNGQDRNADKDIP